MTNITQPVITLDMLISYLEHGEYEKLPPNSSDDLVNVSTLEYLDPYHVEPDLSPEVCPKDCLRHHQCHQDLSQKLLWYYTGVPILLPVSRTRWDTRLYHEFNCVLALLEKQKGW